MKKLRDYVIGVFGVAAVVPLYIIYVFSIPLSVVAIMRILGCEWWAALIYSAVFYAVPFLNLAMFIAPFVGVYYLISADFSFVKAAYPENKIGVLEYEDLSDSKFEKFKIVQIKVPLIERCKQEALKSGFEGKITPQQNAYCDCMGEKVVSSITKADFIKWQSDKAYEAFSDDQKNTMIRECQQ